MDPDEEVFIQFKEDVTEYRNNEHLKPGFKYKTDDNTYYDQHESR